MHRTNEHTTMQFLKKIITPTEFKSWTTHLGMAIPRILAGLMLCFEFGSSKFGMPWSITDKMGLFQVADWFPKDVANFGTPFNWAPEFFAWMAAGTEAIGGLFLVFGLGTRIWGVLLAFTMLGAIFLQKWPDMMEYGSSWPALPAIGFLWVAIYCVLFGSGKWGLDYLFSKKL